MQTQDTQQRIDLIKTALTGADKTVYEWTAKFVHTEAVISLIPLPCCKPTSYIVPTPGADKPPEPKKIKLSLWVPIKLMGKVKKGGTLAAHVAKGAHVQFKKKPSSKVLCEGVVVSNPLKAATILSDAAIEITIPYEQIVNIDAHHAGKAAAGFAITYPASYKS